MPCYQVNLVSVEFKVGNSQILLDMLERKQMSYVKDGNTIYITGGIRVNLEKQTIVAGSNYQANTIKRGYAEQVLMTVAKKKRWAFKKKNDGKYQIRRF